MEVSGVTAADPVRYEDLIARYGVEEDDDWGDPPIGEASVTLGEMALAGSWFGYTYDFGDDWRHRIDVEAVGGPWGCAEFVGAMDTLDHPR